MQTFLFVAFSIFCFGVVCVMYGVLKEQFKQSKQDLQTGEKIDKIISDNSDISDDEWSSWLQERRNK